MKINLKLSFIFFLLFATFFLIPQQFRMGFLSFKLGAFNLPAVFLILVIVVFFGKCLDRKQFFILTASVCFYIITAIFYENKIDILFNISIFFVPIILLAMKLPITIVPSTSKNILILINTMVIIITIIGIIDFLTNKSILNIFLPYMSDSIQEIAMRHSSEIRMYSIYGHPLVNTQIYIIFFILNSVYNKKIKKMININWISIISLVGVAMTASKTGIILVLILILFENIGRVKIFNLILITLILVSAFYFGFFDNLISRFNEGSITTGRSENWEIVKNYNMFPLKLFTGYGRGFAIEYNQYLPNASAAFEYPFRGFALEMGIFNMIIIYINIFFYPFIKFLKNRDFYLVIYFIIIFIDVNTYNGLYLLGDNMLLYCLTIFLLYNLGTVNETGGKL